MEVRRLNASSAADIVSLFTRVYGTTYANPLFYDTSALATALTEGTLSAVGAVDESGRLAAHMAMVRPPRATSAELGNTVVDPEFRGGGVAWQVGAELTRWCRELGYTGFLHYPTCDHPIMQRQSVKSGIETGLMLGYIPAETDAGVSRRGEHRRQAATIVYEPLAAAEPREFYLAEQFAQQIRAFAAEAGVPRTWRTATPSDAARGAATWTFYERRGLARLAVDAVGEDLEEQIEACGDYPCRQVDFALSDPGVAAGVGLALEAGFVFCGWLPGLGASDLLRLQRVDPALTDLNPDVVNPGAQAILQSLGLPPR